MATSRERILGSIRNSLAHAGHLPRAERVRLAPEPAEAREALVERFAQELALVGGVCVRAQTAEAVAERVVALTRGVGVDEVLAWAPDQLPVPGLHEALGAAGIKMVGGELPRHEPARSAAVARLETLRVG